jgi:hypothetical protein
MSTEQTPTRKESLQIENTTFDLEWAKRGGVFVYKEVVDPIWTAKLIAVHKIGMLNIVFTTDLSTERCFRDDMRMATRAECDVAGVEYIEPFKTVTLGDGQHDLRPHEDLDGIAGLYILDKGTGMVGEITQAPRAYVDSDIQAVIKFKNIESLIALKESLNDIGRLYFNESPVKGGE